MKYLPDSSHIIKLKNSLDELSVLIIEFIDSEELLPPEELVEILHRYCYAFILLNQDNDYINCRNINIFRICPYPPEDSENKLIKVEGDVVLDFETLDIINGSIVQAMLGNPDQYNLPEPLTILDTLLRAEVNDQERIKKLNSLNIIMDEETFSNLKELSKRLYNLSFLRDPYSEVEFS